MHLCKQKSHLTNSSKNLPPNKWERMTGIAIHSPCAKWLSKRQSHSTIPHLSTQNKKKTLIKASDLAPEVSLSRQRMPSSLSHKRKWTFGRQMWRLAFNPQPLLPTITMARNRTWIKKRTIWLRTRRMLFLCLEQWVLHLWLLLHSELVSQGWLMISC